MGYVVVVFCIINGVALAAVGYYLRECWKELPMYVSTAIQDEVRKQDDRIEKRLAKREAPEGNPQGINPNGEAPGLRPGMPFRR